MGLLKTLVDMGNVVGQSFGEGGGQRRESIVGTDSNIEKLAWMRTAVVESMCSLICVTILLLWSSSC